MRTHTWLSEDEVLFHRMEGFHRERVDAIASGRSPLGKQEEGLLAVHLIPHSCVRGRKRFDGALLKKQGGLLSALGDEGRYASCRFNVDGVLLLDSGRAIGAYSQVFRDGRVESVMSGVTFKPNGDSTETPWYLRDSICERAVIKLVKEYLAFCSGVGFNPPVAMFSALIGCDGVRFYSEWGNGLGGIDRSPAFLPDIEITTLDADPTTLLRPWCDTLLQACGMEGSPNFDEKGNRRERQR